MQDDFEVDRRIRFWRALLIGFAGLIVLFTIICMVTGRAHAGPTYAEHGEVR